MTTKAEKPSDLTKADLKEQFRYLASQNSFTGLLADIAKDFINVDYPKNKKENIIGYWFAIKLKMLINSVFSWENGAHIPNIRITSQEKVEGLLEMGNFYNLVISIDNVPVIVVDINFIFSNLNANFNRIFKDIVYNANNINQRNGMEYIALTIFAEQTPAFAANKMYDKMEELSIMKLIKLTNLSLCKHNTFECPTIILTPFIDAKAGKPKIKNPQFSNYNIFNEQALRDNFPIEVFHHVNHSILMQDINEFIRRIVSKISNRVFSC